MSDNVKYSPMMEEYLKTKNEYKDMILFYRIGDFYEMFFDDAYLASKELELALTGKDAGVSERVPMCGVPFHAADQYIEKLVSRGYKVAVAEQVEDPKLAKGLVKREVIKIVTPGTIDSGILDKENNYIASIIYANKEYILCYSDITTGDGNIVNFKNYDLLFNEILSLHIKELVISNDLNIAGLDDFLKQNQIILSIENKKEIPPSLQFIVSDIDPMYHSAVGILIEYFIDTKKIIPNHFKKFKSYVSEKYLHLDAFTKKNLELTETLRLANKSGSLLHLLDNCSTAMGSRLLHKWLDRPLSDVALINERLNMVEILNNSYIIKEEIKSYFKNVYDLERIIGRISSGNCNAKDLVWLRRSLKYIPEVINKLDELGFIELKNHMNPHNDLYELLAEALVEDPPLSIKEGGMINEGFNSELDEIKNISKNGKDWIINYEQQQRESTGVKTLKVGYNRVQGYYIEITKMALKEIKDTSMYERKATLSNSERFITKELKDYEQLVMNAKEKIESLEYEIFVSLRKKAFEYIKSLQELANDIAILDCYISLSDVAIKNNYKKPTFNSLHEVSIVNGRHPVLETIVKSNYIVNNVDINKCDMILITGPNMSGKSTYMKMLALIVIMAQIGSFVPASSANLMIFDSIFTRIGASDDLVSGQSTFMVEMVEANYAISNATKNSLVLFDEIGRGTATFDGMALAQAILEYLHERVGCVTLFSTHYHELTALEDKLKRLKNVHVEAEETKDNVTFLHKVIDGPTDKSYGINVASLAGLPKSLIKRSKDILEALEKENNSKKGVLLNLFNFEEYDNLEEVKKESTASLIKKRLDSIDINRLSPIEALNLLYELKEMK